MDDIKDRRKKEVKRRIDYLSNPNNLDRNTKRTVRLIHFYCRSISTNTFEINVDTRE